jgi:hypothetical protein
LPNLKGKVGVGKDGTQTEFDTLGETGGEKTHTLTTNEIPSHNHGIRSVFGENGNIVLQAGGSFGWSVDQNKKTSNEGGGQAHNNLQPYLVVNYIIKVAQTTVTTAQVTNSYSTSTSDSYSCDYINNINTYSTNEIRVGTWIDNKPIYRKMVDFGALPSNTLGSVNHNISNVKHIHINLGETIWCPNDQNYNEGGMHSPIHEWFRDIEVTTTQIIIMTNSINASNWHMLVCLEYTKTTD